MGIIPEDETGHDLSIKVSNRNSLYFCCCSVTKLCPTVCIPVECSTPGSSVLHYLLELLKLMCPLSRWCYLTLSSSATPFSFCSRQSFSMSQLFTSGDQSIGASTLSSVLQMNIHKVDFLQNWLLWSPWSPKDSQEYSPAPQSERINSSVLSFLYGPTLTSIHHCWKP